MQHLQLQRTLNFTVDDLRANQDGRISEAQFEKHKPPEFSQLALYVIFGHAIAIVGLLSAIALISQRPAMWIVVAVVLALGLMPFLVMNNEGNINPTLRGDVQRGKVVKACGIAIITKNQGRTATSYELYIDGITIKLTANQAGAFISERDYCVYYLPLSLTLLSAEPYEPELS